MTVDLKTSLGALLLAPWRTLALLSSAKSFVDNPILGSRWLNARGLHVGRLRLAHAMTHARRERLAHRVSPEDRAAFERDGFVLRRELLPPAQFAALREQLLAQAAPAREMLQGDTVTRRIAVDAALRRQVPALQPFIAHPAWQGLTRYVAGYRREPWVYVQSILSQTREAPPDPQTHLHADTFHPTMKAWYFLTDVAEDEGPFCYVPGSHRLTPQRLAWEQAMSLRASEQADRYSARGSFRIAEAELAALGLPPPRRFAVPANTLIVADTFGFHARGPSARPSTRIELWGYDRRNPFWPGSTDGGLALLGLTGRRPALYWRLLDTLERWGGRRNPWRDAGRLTAGAPPASPGGPA
ncbi:MAG TPA: phytanoyl-CoA dioxygenase family protein [Ideonella sp.]|nr:phytanoyl-CoA dioxygenase family protein [Ideonella sp.]